MPIVRAEEASLSGPRMVNIVPERSVKITLQDAGDDLLNLCVRWISIMDSSGGRSNELVLLPICGCGRIPVTHIIAVVVHEVVVAVQISQVRYFPGSLAMVDEVLRELHWLRVAAVGPPDPIYRRVIFHCHVVLDALNLNAVAVPCAILIDYRLPCEGRCDVALGGVASGERYFGPRVASEIKLEHWVQPLARSVFVLQT